MLLLMILPGTAWAYAVRTAATAVVGAWCLLAGGPRSVAATAGSDKSAASPNPAHLGEAALSPLRLFLGLLMGVLVTVIWIVPEGSDFYRTWCCRPDGSLPRAPAGPSPFEPAACGWPLTIARLVGSAFVIAPVEEGFFRSFLYRWLQKCDFRAVPLSRFDLSAFLWTLSLFALGHDRLLVAAVTGALYGFTAIRWGLASAVAAHVTTNLLLALHVIFSRAWSFW